MNETLFLFVCVCCRSIWFLRMWKIILCLSVICLTTLTNGNYASHEFTEDVMFCETCQLQQGAKFMVLQLSEMTRFWQWRTNGRTWLPFVGLCSSSARWFWVSIPLMTSIVYIFGICCFGKSLEFWIQKSVRNLFAQYDDVIESKQCHPLPTPHSTSSYNPCVNEILSMVNMIRKWLSRVIWVYSMQQQYISPQTQFSQSVFRVSLLYPILTLLCIFPLLKKASPVILRKYIYIYILSFVIWTTALRGISATKKNCHQSHVKIP